MSRKFFDASNPYTVYYILNIVYVLVINEFYIAIINILFHNSFEIEFT